MSWLEELYNTYENCSLYDDSLIPPFHMFNNTQIEIRISENGDFIDANLDELKNTIIPCTSKSEAARTMNPPPHPLCDKIQFVAKDYKGKKPSYFDKYISLIDKWANSGYSHPMVNAVYSYVKKGTLICDLRNTNKDIILDYEDSGDLFVRWKVEIPGENEVRCWKSKSLYKSWQAFYENQESVKGVCMVIGETRSLALNHPKRIRNSGDGGKLISSNDKTGFTFRGRFFTNEATIDDKKVEIVIQPATISSEVSQKAHRALSWLINRQGFRNGDQVIVSWAVSGKDIPVVLADSLSIFGESDDEKFTEVSTVQFNDAGQTFARKLNRKLSGYKADLKNTDKIIVMGLDSAGPGRISITFYRELSGSDFLERIEQWHNNMAWHFLEFMQDPCDKRNKYAVKIVFAPAPKVIAEACFGKRLDDKLKKSTIERLLPCIIDGRQVPVDLVDMSVKRASNKIGLDHWEWERTLSVACSLFRCFSIRNINNTNKSDYSMYLENERTDRDYLYGRLLAIAEHLEEMALYVANEKRETSAARLMQRFADFPFSTWRNIESALVPYKSRLYANRPGTLYKMKNLLDEVHTKFQSGDFEKDSRLSGAYLLGYHCQRLELKTRKNDEEV